MTSKDPRNVQPDPSAELADAPSATPDSTPASAPAPVPAAQDSFSAEDRVAFAEFQKEQSKVKGSFAASTWAALIVGFLLLILLIIFILQNQQPAELNFFNWSGQLPAGIAFLIFAIAGALIMALVGGWRMSELRRQVRKQAQRH